MAKIDKEYLLCKISDQSVFNAEATKENLYEWINNDDKLTKKEKNRITSEIKKIKNTSNFLIFLDRLEHIKGINPSECFDECFENDYPTSAKTFAEIFEKVIQPEIKKYIKEEQQCN